jgi:hypothetical protein
MSENLESGGPKGFCTNCGSQTRLGNAFCVHCGVRLSSNASAAPNAFDGDGPSQIPVSSVSSQTANLKESFLYSKRKVVGWLRDLPTGIKIALGILILLVFVLLMTRIAMILAVVALVISILGIVFGVTRRKRITSWSVAAGVSVLVLATGGVTSALSENDVAGTFSGPAEGQYEVGNVDEPAANVPPELEPIVEDWPDDGPPLFLPTRLPFDVAETIVKDSSSGSYEIRGEVGSSSPKIEYTVLGKSFGFLSYPMPGASSFSIDGRSYTFVVEAESPQAGSYSIQFWEEVGSGGAEQYAEDDSLRNFRISLTDFPNEANGFAPTPPDEYIAMVQSIVRIDSSDGSYE